MGTDADVPPGFTPFHSPQTFKWLTSSGDSGPSPSPPPPPSSAPVSESAGGEASCQVSIDEETDHHLKKCQRRQSFCCYYTRRPKGKRVPFLDSNLSARPGSSEEPQFVLALELHQETDLINGVRVSRKLTGTSAAAGPLSLPPSVSSTTGSESASRLAICSLPKGPCMQDYLTPVTQASRRRVRPQFFDPSPPSSSLKKRKLVLALAHQETSSRDGVRVSVASSKMPQKHLILSTQTIGDRICPVTESRMGQMKELALCASFEPWCSSIDTGFLQHVADAFEDSSGSLDQGIQSKKGPSIMKPSLQPTLYRMKPSLQPTLFRILNVYGDITKDCPLESGNSILTSVLEGICNVVQELQQKQLTELNYSILNCYYSAVSDAEVIKLDVKWLHDQLDEIKDAVKSIVETKRIFDEKNKCMRRVEKYTEELQSMNVKLETLNSRIKDKEKMLELDKVETEALNQRISALMPRFRHFQSMPLMKLF